jgi:hypothetical protein
MLYLELRTLILLGKLKQLTQNLREYGDNDNQSPSKPARKEGIG